jgi:hypothetical protein
MAGSKQTDEAGAELTPGTRPATRGRHRRVPSADSGVPAQWAEAVYGGPEPGSDHSILTPSDIEWLTSVAGKMGGYGTGVGVRDRTHHFHKYKRCFVGQRAVGWLIQHSFCKDMTEAVSVGQDMLDAGLIEHVLGEQRFLNRSTAFYRFAVQAQSQRSRSNAQVPAVAATPTTAKEELNVRLASPLELKQRLEMAEEMVDFLCEGLTDVCTTSEDLRLRLESALRTSTAQLHSTERMLLVQIAVVMVSAALVVLLTCVGPELLPYLGVLGLHAAHFTPRSAAAAVTAVALPLSLGSLWQHRHSRRSAAKREHRASAALQRRLHSSRTVAAMVANEEDDEEDDDGTGTDAGEDKNRPIPRRWTAQLLRRAQNAHNQKPRLGESWGGRDGNQIRDLSKSAEFETGWQPQDKAQDGSDSEEREMFYEAENEDGDEEDEEFAFPAAFRSQNPHLHAPEKKAPRKHRHRDLNRSPADSPPQGAGLDLVAGAAQPPLWDEHRHRMLLHVDEAGWGGRGIGGVGWSEPPGSVFRVRGPDYFKDGGRKQPSQPPLLALARVDFATVEEHIPHIAAHQASAVALQLRASHAASRLGYDSDGGNSEVAPMLPTDVTPRILCLQFLMPAHSLVFWFVQRRPFRADDPAERLADRMLSTVEAGAADAEAEMAWKASRFKLIPHIEEGGFVVKKVVGSRPALIGKDEALTSFHSGPHYLEVDIDISNSYMASKILSVVQGYAASLVVDLGFVVEGRLGDDDAASGDGHGKGKSELPERLLAALRLHHIQMDVLPKG